jgi:Uma2 family endonuclease
MSTAPSQRRFSVAEYLALEQDSLTKHEYCRGQIVAMAGASIRHNQISVNIVAGLHARLRGQPCRPYGSDQRIRIDAADLYTYTDTAVICGPIERDPNDPQAAKNLRVIVEVLSKSTEKYDRGEKFELYQQLPSLEEYVLVSQEDARITHLMRLDDGSWRYVLIAGLDQTLHLASLACDLPLAEIYDGVTLGPEEDTAT